MNHLEAQTRKAEFTRKWSIQIFQSNDLLSGPAAKRKLFWGRVKWLRWLHFGSKMTCFWSRFLLFPGPFRELKRDPPVGRYWLETQGKQMVSALSGVTQGDHSGAQNESFSGFHFGHIWCPPHPPNMVPTRGKESSQQFLRMNDCSLCRPRKKEIGQQI